MAETIYCHTAFSSLASRDEKEAIDVNFAIHFPWLDKLFGTYYMPPKQWPSGYGIGGHPVPNGYWQQFLYPFKRKTKSI